MYAKVFELMTTPPFQQYNDLLYSVINKSEVLFINQDEILNEHPDLYRTSEDKQKVIVKYTGPMEPQSLIDVNHDGPYDHMAIQSLLASEEWYKDPTKTHHPTVKLT